MYNLLSWAQSIAINRAITYLRTYKLLELTYTKLDRFLMDIWNPEHINYFKFSYRTNFTRYTYMRKDTPEATM
jgi:hypothetical protein